MATGILYWLYVSVVAYKFLNGFVFKNFENDQAFLKTVFQNC